MTKTKEDIVINVITAVVLILMFPFMLLFIFIDGFTRRSKEMHKKYEDIGRPRKYRP